MFQIVGSFPTFTFHKVVYRHYTITAESKGKKFWKSINICRSYGQLSRGVVFLWNTVYYVANYLVKLAMFRSLAIPLWLRLVQGNNSVSIAELQPWSYMLIGLRFWLLGGHSFCCMKSGVSYQICFSYICGSCNSTTYCNNKVKVHCVIDIRLHLHISCMSSSERTITTGAHLTKLNSENILGQLFFWLTMHMQSLTVSVTNTVQFTLVVRWHRETGGAADKDRHRHQRLLQSLLLLYGTDYQLTFEPQRARFKHLHKNWKLFMPAGASEDFLFCTVETDSLLLLLLLLFIAETDLCLKAWM